MDRRRYRWRYRYVWQDEDGTNTTDIGKITCILNKYFATVFTEEDLSDMPVPTKMCNSDEEMDEIDTS